MTELKTKKHGNEWFEPGLWITADRINFRVYCVRIDNKTYSVGSPKFVKAFEDDRILRTLKQ